MTWTEERVETLVQLWSEGLSSQQIADKLGGVTRSAVGGKAHRLNLERGVPRPKIKKEKKKLSPSPTPKEPVLPRGVRLERWMCRWPTDDPGRHGLYICGKTHQPGRPYCAEHLTVEYLTQNSASG